jgi:transcriptional regulator with XRE-family HTH domain
MIDQTLGNSLQLLRKSQGLTLRDLAKRTHFTASFLCQIEKGHCSASISSVERIAQALGSTISQLVLAANPQTARVIRASERTGVRTSLADLAQFKVSVLDLEAGKDFERGAVSVEFAIVVKGCVVLKLADSSFTIGRGDSVTIAAGSGGRWRNDTDAVAEILLVSAGPDNSG